jgi:hypothetical protein
MDAITSEEVKKKLMLERFQEEVSAHIRGFVLFVQFHTTQSDVR